MGIIHSLDAFTANSIAAGEVVERPSSVVKELIENSLDAGASVITIEAQQGGIRMIRVTDNGCGMQPEDARIAFMRHATSKIRQIEDLQTLRTMGFRGEALASIAAVSEITIETRPDGAQQGITLNLSAGEITQEKASGCPAGTMVQVNNLFFNQPARFKFLKRDQTEASYITDLIERMALARPDISFRLLIDSREVLHTPGNDDLLSSIFSVYGKATAQACLPVQFEDTPIQIQGFIASPDQSRHNRNRQNFFVNQRLIRSKMLTAALDEAVRSWYVKGRFPSFVLIIQVPTALVDVNVHPQKLEVRFWDEKKVFHCVYHAVKQALREGIGIAGQETTETAYPVSQQTVTGRMPIADLSDLASYTENRASDPANPSANLKSHATAVAENHPAEPVIPAAVQANHSSEPAHHGTEQIADPRVDCGVESRPAAASVRLLAGARIIGQAFQTYLIIESGSDLFLIDQHAAHERILYERLLNNHKSFKRDQADIQTLLVPETIPVTRSEKSLLMEHQQAIHDLGFDYDEFGEDAILLRGIPAAAFERIVPSAAFRVVIDTLTNQTASQPMWRNIRVLYESMACKAAVKANDMLQDSEMKQLLIDLQTLENPYHCPHGRPVIIQLSQQELERRFKRRV